MVRAKGRSRRLGSFILLTLFLIALSIGMARPRATRADNLPLIIGVSVAAFLVVVLGGTWLVYGRQYDRKQPFLPDPELPPGAREGFEGVRFAPHCRPTDGEAPILCW